MQHGDLRQSPEGKVLPTTPEEIMKVLRPPRLIISVPSAKRPPALIRTKLARQKYRENAVVVTKTLISSLRTIFSDVGSRIMEPNSGSRANYGAEGLGEVALVREAGHLCSDYDRFA